MFVNIPDEAYKFEPIDYLANGKNCVYTAQILKDGPDKLKKNYPMRVLLVHGIELLLQAFILHFDKSKFIRVHDIKKLYSLAEKIDNSLNLNLLTNDLSCAINDVVLDYYSDSVKARYKNKDSSLNFSLFLILKKSLIQPLEKAIHL
ncbi:MAG: hypothetical protein EXS51_02400 [Candidatus Taylorbacteria bacterium]|nr:hypothetical protein [Candidatus Taylorbacteria bacterium]